MPTEADSYAVCSENHEGHQVVPHEESVSDYLETPPDLPPDSFWVSKEEELDWFDRNAFIERRGSTKLSNHHAKTFSHSSSFSLNQKLKTSAAVGAGVPKSQNYSCFAGRSFQRGGKPATAGRLFRSRSEPDGKRGVIREETEPVSPLVSCIGRVRSKRVRRKKTGFWGILKAAFRLNREVSKKSSGLV